MFNSVKGLSPMYEISLGLTDLTEQFNIILTFSCCIENYPKLCHCKQNSQYYFSHVCRLTGIRWKHRRYFCSHILTVNYAIVINTISPIRKIILRLHTLFSILQALDSKSCGSNQGSSVLVDVLDVLESLDVKIFCLVFFFFF